LEEMIKRRIIASDFDEVIRRRPDDISSRFRRGRIELDDSKPQQGLAEIYEREHLQKIDPENTPDIKDEKLAEAHREIGELFSDVSRKLDALSSWHFTPKPPKPAISIVVDAPAISMEEAQPSAADGGALAANISMLAPQEVYAPQKGRAVATIGEGGGREIVGKSGAPVSTREMTREDKQRRRRREKEKIKKRNLGEGNKGGEVKEGSRKDVRNSLRKGRVKVIGEGGEKRDVDGNLVKDKGGGTKSSFLKL
jgi:U3 small nucleolar RNA-associated protein MPP10